jgi:hypothetical protein
MSSSDDGLRMPWSGWVVVIALFVSLNSVGSFLMLILLSPAMMINYFWQDHPAAIVATARAIGIKAQYVCPLALFIGLGLLFVVLALRNPERRAYRHAAILLLGFLLAGAISVRNLSGFAGI